MFAKWNVLGDLIDGARGFPIKRFLGFDATTGAARAPIALSEIAPDAARATSNGLALLAAVDGGHPLVTAAGVAADSRAWARIDKGVLETGLETLAASHGATLLRGHEVTGISLGPEGVAVTAAGLEDAVRGRLLIMADGGSGLGEEALGLGRKIHPESGTFAGMHFPVADADITVRRTVAEEAGEHLPTFGLNDHKHTLVWTRLRRDQLPLAADTKRGVHGASEELTRIIQERAGSIGVGGVPLDQKPLVVDVVLREAERAIGPHGSIAIGNALAAGNFDNSSWMNLAVLQAEEAAQYAIEALKPGADIAALQERFNARVMEGVHALMAKSRTSMLKP